MKIYPFCAYVFVSIRGIWIFSYPEALNFLRILIRTLRIRYTNLLIL